MKRTIGYVVLDGNSAMQIGDDDVLWIPSGKVPVATVFSTLRAARAAIARTNAFSDANGYQWSKLQRVFRLTA